MGFLPREICNVIIPMFSYPSTGPHLAWLDTDWEWIPQSHWLAPNRTYSIFGSDLWVWCPPGWIGRFTLGLAFTHGFTFSELPEKLLICHTLELTGRGLCFTGMIMWLQYSLPLWELQKLCYELML